MGPKKIAIVGLGLMGGSLAVACRRKFPRTTIIGISRNRQALAKAKKKRWIHEGTIHLQEGVAEVDFIVLCTPIDTFTTYMKVLDKCVRPGTIVTDVGSAKYRIMHQIEKRKWKRVQLVSAHPMVGSHRRGIQAVVPRLYDQGLTFLIKSKGMSPKAYRVVKAFWCKISAKVVEVSALEHDQIVSEISHLPHIVAMCLVLAIPKRSLTFASSGFRDATRLALGSPSVWMPILQANQSEISEAIRRFQGKMSSLRKLCQRGKGRDLEKMLEKAALIRAQI